MSEQTNNLVQLFSKFLRNPKVLAALRNELVSARLQQRQGRNGAQGLLVQLWKQDGLTNTEISELLDIKPSSVTNQVKNLESRGLVERKTDEADKRVSRVFLTEAGKELKSQRSEQHDEKSEELFAALDQAEQAELLVLMQKLVANSDDEDVFNMFDGDLDGMWKFNPQKHHEHQIMRHEMQEMGREMRREAWQNRKDFGWGFGKRSGKRDDTKKED